MMSSILSFVWGIVSTMLEHPILYIHSTLADCYILKYFLLNLVQRHPGLRGGFGHTNIYMVFQSNTALRIENYIVCGLLWTWYRRLTQTAPFIIKPVDGRFDCSFSTNSGKFDHLKIDRFQCISKKYMKNI